MRKLHHWNCGLVMLTGDSCSAEESCQKYKNQKHKTQNTKHKTQNTYTALRNVYSKNYESHCC